MSPSELLALVAIGYRGCDQNLSLPHSRKRVADEITRCLNSFAPVQAGGGWSLVWGPAGYRPGIAGLDTSAMYVAVSKASPSTIAILIRGTNTFSVQDWASNLLIEPREWIYGPLGGQAKVSLSVWLQLKILQTLKSEPLVALPPEGVLENLQAAVALHQAQFEYAVLKEVLAGTIPYDATGLLAGVLKHFPHLVVAGGAAADEAAVVDEVNQAQSIAADAFTLIHFLQEFVSRAAEPIDIHIAGHSKGGAIAVALALWLADTQGIGARPEAWDPRSRARLHVCSFAAPTAGNLEFGNHFRAKFPSAAYRFANPHDIVPHAWKPDDIRAIPTLYGPQLSNLKVEAETIADLVGPLGYQHEVAPEAWDSEPLTPRSLPLQFAFNHLDAYLIKLGIYDQRTLSLLSLIAPLG
jgi:hypothetical protein